MGVRRQICRLAVLMMLAACGFQPVYQREAGLDTPDILQQIAIQTPGGREGDQLKAALEDHFRQFQPPRDPRHRLEIALRIDSSPFVFSQDGTASRFELQLRSSYVLRRTTDNQALKKGMLQRTVSYNVSQQEDFATFVSQQDALKQGIDELAELYRLRIMAHLQTALDRS